MLDIFKKQRQRYATVNPVTRDIPDGLWVKCPRCHEIQYSGELAKQLKVCARCGYHFRLSARERLKITIDEGTFIEWDGDMEPVNPFQNPEYGEKLARAQQESGLKEAVVTGEGDIAGHRVAVAVMDTRFMMASMGTVVGEKITRAIERAREKRLPLIIFSASGGARMQEGIFSLMQMARTCAALSFFSSAGLLYISVLTDPTTGGVSASFAFAGDIILAEPGALIGFAGPRVIEQTIRQKLPEGFQSAEFLRQHGFVDAVVPRPLLKKTLAQILDLHRSD
ncbi:acetyl-CoA carboxylase, carboxyltransferase subunit beta [Desulfofundulus thermocisternus]|uniref:acetyl-CoA carboxylase, carboxyltransferase subunit beta n=1 Tax=Desulfofundulus thermocisternus TaxID=42471 RepID=UPI00217F20EB|nr:acetyl-CoA carboxylase, carboxyltransferase subunit beta [Desulfofundulus thermocisternus]MCS5696310.1 acetyl-CoA carboxylase, carboxyltransferase subunit beta [Desulfofundulus thermocisternus]